MAPICSDPRQIVISLNPARRKAVLQLVEDIISHIKTSLQAPSSQLGPVAPSDPTAKPNSTQDSPSDNRQLTPEHRTISADRIQQAALRHLSEWRNEFIPKLEEIVNVQDTPKIQVERRVRREKLDKEQDESDIEEPEELISFGENLINFGETQESEDMSRLQSLYPPIKTRLTTIPPEDRREILSCVLLLLLSTGKYSAYSRTLSLYLASSLGLTQAVLNKEEIEIAKSLMESSSASNDKKEAMSAEAEAAKRQQENKASRFWKVGLASVAGAAIIGVTGGLAAPLVAGAIGGVMGGIGLGGVASFLGIFWMNGALVGTLFGAYGAKMTGEMMDKYAREVEDFKFIPLNDDEAAASDSSETKQSRRLRVTIGVNGWLNSETDVTKPWRVLDAGSEVFALRYEMHSLLALGSALEDLIRSATWKYLKSEIIKRTILATLFAALWPIQMLGMASNIDNPFHHAQNRSVKAGRLLADALINKAQGERPVTLVGYSVGAVVIHACLQSLAQRQAFGLVDTVVIIGTPAPSNSAHWRTISTVVSGKIFNVYSENDMILGFVYRLHSLEFGVAGLQAIENVQSVHNLDLSDRVSGHLRYAGLTGEILRQCGFLNVKASDEIDKDDVIKMKDEYAQGSLLDLDDSHAQHPDLKGEPEKLASGMSSMSIAEAANPQRPPASTHDKVAQGEAQDALLKGESSRTSNLTRSTTAPEPEDMHPSAPKQRPPPERSPWSDVPLTRPRAPSVDPYDSDGSHVGIKMVDNDSD
ncbi:hypothetical protein B0I35DRAFT_477781 [Stachybotrys elegans]|uniref:Uncharacterized protein n=1 Tax=Stachybotrys elegans TaxID=80388 RepID=A0A8K0SY55_9HYPO|nr:hypothetical protein B0I35DRAFT_477781 [Stachybotrys elegans]